LRIADFFVGADFFRGAPFRVGGLRPSLTAVFDPLTPSARSANLIAGDGTKNGFPAPNEEPAKTKNAYFTGKAPYKSGANLAFGNESHR
jgi:hypothetical protein